MDQKNIRRRVYDALNVLMAMNIIQKDKKDIKWIGLPTNARHELETFSNEKIERLERIKRKQGNLEELLSQQSCYKNLVERNSRSEFSSIDSKIHLPFIIVNTRSSTVIECEVADDRSAYFFNFSQPFEIHDDSEILRRILLTPNNNNNNSNNTTNTNNNNTNTTTTNSSNSNVATAAITETSSNNNEKNIGITNNNENQTIT